MKKRVKKYKLKDSVKFIIMIMAFITFVGVVEYFTHDRIEKINNGEITVVSEEYMK